MDLLEKVISLEDVAVFTEGSSPKKIRFLMDMSENKTSNFCPPDKNLDFLSGHGFSLLT